MQESEAWLRSPEPLVQKHCPAQHPQFIAVQVLCPYKDFMSFTAQNEAPNLVEFLVVVMQISVETCCLLMCRNRICGGWQLAKL